MEFDFAKPLSTMKYGFFIGIASIPAIILIAIVVLIFGGMMTAAFEGGSVESGLIILIIAPIVITIVVTIASIQIITFALNSAFSDAMPTYESLGYFATWGKAVSIFIELLFLFIIIIVIFVLGIVVAESSPGLFLVLYLVGIVMFILAYMGLIPYVCRRVLEKDDDAGSGNVGGSQLEPISQSDALEGLYPPGSGGN